MPSMCCIVSPPCPKPAYVCMYACLYVCSMYVLMCVCSMYVCVYVVCTLYECMTVCMYVCIMYVCMYRCMYSKCKRARLRPRLTFMIFDATVLTFMTIILIFRN
jgi:hypothetical protein